MIIFFEIGKDNNLIYDIKGKKCRKFICNTDKFLFSDKIISYLLKEDKFKFYKKKVNISGTKNKNIDLFQIVNFEVKKILKDISGELIYYFISNLNKYEYLLSFDLICVFLDQILLEDLKINCLKCINDINNLVYFYPQSIFTVFELSKIKKDFSLVYFFDEEIKLLNVQDGFIKDVFYLNFGLIHLKSIFIEKGIQNIYVKLFNGENLSNIEENIVNNIIKEYIKIISNWIRENSNSQYYFLNNDKIIRYFKDFFKNSMFLVLKDVENGNCNCKNIDVKNYLKYFDKIKFTYLKV